MLGRTLAQIAGEDEAKLSAEQKKIEDEIAAFEKNIYGDQARKDSLDSLKVQTATEKKSKKTARKSSSTSVRSTKKAKSKTKSSSSSSSARVSARRERH